MYRYFFKNMGYGKLLHLLAPGVTKHGLCGVTKGHIFLKLKRKTTRVLPHVFIAYILGFLDFQGFFF